MSFLSGCSWATFWAKLSYISSTWANCKILAMWIFNIWSLWCSSFSTNFISSTNKIRPVMEQENKRETMIMSRGWAQDFLWASRARRLSLSLSLDLTLLLSEFVRPSVHWLERTPKKSRVLFPESKGPKRNINSSHYNEVKRCFMYLSRYVRRKKKYFWKSGLN